MLLDSLGLNPLAEAARRYQDRHTPLEIKVQLLGYLLRHSYPTYKAVEYKLNLPATATGAREVRYRWVEASEPEAVDTTAEPVPPERQIEMPLQ